MTAVSNSRLATIPCERMRGCSFADNFVTLATMADNNASYPPSGVSCDHGLVLDYDGWVKYDIVAQPGDFSVVVRFLTGVTASAANYLIYNAAIAGGSNGHGFAIWLDSDGVKANYGNTIAGSNATQCAVDLDYSDNEIHTITYVVDITNNQHHLYVDSLDVDTVAATVAGDIGSVDAITLGGDPVTSVGFIGTLYKARIFNEVLTESEHDLYHTGSLTDFMELPFAVWRCDSFCNDTDGHKIWDRTTNLRDLYKADQSTSTKFPTFDTDKYSFDRVDDYVSNIPTLPSTYTVVAALSTPQNSLPEIRQENDTTLLDALSTEGSHWGYLHNLAIHSGAINQLQLYHTEYMHLYNLARGRATGAYHRLITEGTCKMAMFLDSGHGIFTNYSRLGASGSGHSVTENGSDGCSFGSSDSHVLVAHNDSFQTEEITLCIYGDFDTPSGTGTAISKGANYGFSTTGAVLNFWGTGPISYVSHVTNSNAQFAVTCKSGYKPRFYVDGTYIGEGNNAITLDNTSTDDLLIGNYSTLTLPFVHNLKQVYIGDKALTKNEIRALYQEAQIIGATAMEVGNRTRYRQTFTGTAVDIDQVPGDAFQMISVSFDFNTVPTTSEDITIAIINSDTDTVTLYSWDPSTTTETSQYYAFPYGEGRIDATGGNATVAIDYANTDARNITVNAVWQLDPSV